MEHAVCRTDRTLTTTTFLNLITFGHQISVIGCQRREISLLTFRHRASCFIGQAFRYSPENAFYVFNQQIYFII